MSLEVEDLPAELTALRERAQALTASPMICKLLIPDAQIKYLTFDGQGATGEALEQAVRTHLDGATPYALDDLAYDWSFEAGQVHVAAVAHETLAEAEDFATLHGFAPVSFVARPAQGRFVGEPWFGETAQAARHLPEGETLERDTAPVRIIGPAPPARRHERDSRRRRNAPRRRNSARTRNARRSASAFRRRQRTGDRRG
ncbi:hypothetical protein [Roseovarius pacificus]|uniref:hypothetical protein n=1 Tax=Roseovarius pacificus TaxID=337701 RepID=UPI003748FA68